MMYEDILNACQAIAEQAEDRKMEEMVAGVAAAVESPEGLAIIDMNGADASVLKAAGALCGAELPGSLMDFFKNGSVCFRAEAAEEAFVRIVGGNTEAPALVGKTAGGITELVCGVPGGALGSQRLMICSAISRMNERRELLNHISAFCFRVNATMAMSYQEKQLIAMLGEQSEISPVSVWLDRQDKLNTDEELEDVKRSIQYVFRKAGVPYELHNSAEEAVRWMEQVRRDPDLREKRVRRAQQGMLADMSARLDELMEVAGEDGRNIAVVIRQLEKQRDYLKAAGEAAASSVLNNALAPLKYQLHDGMRDYSNQMIEQICARLASASPDELERMEDLIQRYQERAWRLYEEKLSVQLQKEYDEIFKQIMARIESDIGEMLDKMGGESVEILGRIICDLELDMRGSDAGGDELNAIEKVKRESRNLMLLSVPVVLVNVPLALATLVGAKLVEKIRMKGAEESYRQAMISQVRLNGTAQLQQMLAQVDRRFEEAMEKSAGNIRKAYQELIDVMIADLNQVAQRQERIARKAELYREIRETQIPRLADALNRQ